MSLLLFLLSFSGWLGWGGNAKAESGPSKPKEKQINEPATPVYPKFGLADALREATSICVSPNEKLAAVTDSLGRVILIDLLRGIAVRFWKGKQVVEFLIMFFCYIFNFI